jgi:hypothetical protein
MFGSEQSKAILAVSMLGVILGVGVVYLWLLITICVRN